jgi:hypothetical protein
MKCCICYLEGVIDYEHIHAGEHDLWEMAVYKIVLKNRRLDDVFLQIIFGQLGWRYDRQDGYICGTCREKITKVIQKFYQPVKNITNKEFIK